MLNRITVTIDGLEYTVISEESPEYIRKTAELVDKSIADIRKNSSFSALSCSVLAAMNIADQFYKALDSDDNLRAQVRSYANECAELRAELARLKPKEGEPARVKPTPVSEKQAQSAHTEAK